MSFSHPRLQGGFHPLIHALFPTLKIAGPNSAHLHTQRDNTSLTPLREHTPTQ